MSLTRHPKIENLWVARIYMDGRKKDPKTGRPSNKRESFMYEGDEAGALNWYAALQRGPRKMAKVIPLAPTLEQAWPEFCLYYKNHASESTYEVFLLVWARHLKPFFGKLRPQQLSPSLIESYKAKRASDTYLPGLPAQKPEDDTPEQKAKRKPVGKTSTQKELNYLKSMVGWMTAPEQNMAMPLTWKIKNYTQKQVATAPKIVPDRRAVLKFLRALKGKTDRKGKYHPGDRIYRSMFAIIYNAGLRKSEAFNLKGQQIDLAHGWIYINGKGNKNRTIPIHPKLRVWIRKSHRPGYLWLNPETGQPFDDVKKAVKRGAKKSAYPPDRLHPHILRDAFAVQALISGANLRTLQLVMGHASIKTTERYLTLVPQHLTDDMHNFGRKQRGALHHKAKNKT